ncbi:MAG: oxygenase MpaB family protein [Acidimicrobiia bacterium]
MTRVIGTASGAAFAPARTLIRNAARSALAGQPTGAPELEFATDEDLGLFGPGSVTWRVHADRSMLIGGVRALLLQVLHPLAMAGVAQHSAYREDPLGRLARTGRFVAATTYGTTPEAERAIAMVRKVHRRVRGTAADGRPYEASDPILLAWVHNVEVDSFLSAYRRYGPGLDDADADRYVAEMAVLGRRLGAFDVPETARELSDWIVRAPDLAMTADAREAVRFLVLPTLPARMLPIYGIIAAAAADLLPFGHRITLGLWPVPLADPLVVRPAASVLLAVLGWALGAPPLPSGHE